MLGGLLACAFALAVSGVVRGGQAQPAPATSVTPAPWTVLSKDGRQPLPVVASNGREMVALSELTRLFGLVVREDAVTRGLSISVQGRTIVVSVSQGLASIGGRVVTMSVPPQRVGQAWLVPIDFIDRVLALVYQPGLEVRPASRLVLVGGVRVPRVVVRVEASTGQTRA